MYTRLKYAITDVSTEIQIDQPFKKIFMKIIGTDVDIDFSKSTLRVGEYTNTFEFYNLVSAFHDLDFIYEDLLFLSHLKPEPITKLQFNLSLKGQFFPCELYIVLVNDDDHNDILCVERKSGMRDIGSLSWMCNDSAYLEKEKNV